jgi:hypothetical protein
MAMSIADARPIAAQLAAGLISRREIELVHGDLEQNAAIAATLFQTIVNNLAPPQRPPTSQPLRM